MEDAKTPTRKAQHWRDQAPIKIAEMRTNVRRLLKKKVGTFTEEMVDEFLDAYDRGWNSKAGS